MYMVYFFYFLLVVFICFFLYFFSLFFKESGKNPWSDLAFECGFEPSTSLPPPFSLHFFSITIVFLIFDLEIVILIPLVLVESFYFSFLVKVGIFFVILLGLIVEWYDGSLDWEF